MSMRRTLERNRQMKKIAQGVMQKWEKATIHAIDGNRVHLRLGNAPNLIRHVEVAGDVSALAPGQEVPILWKDNRPVVVQSGAALVPTALASAARGNIPIYIKLYQSVAQSIPNAVETPIIFDTVLADTVGWWDEAAPDRIVVQEGGLYCITGEITYTSGSTGSRCTRILVNESEISRSQMPTGAQDFVHIACFAQLNEGDRVQIAAYQNNGTAQTTIITDGIPNSPCMTLIRVREVAR